MVMTALRLPLLHGKVELILKISARFSAGADILTKITSLQMRLVCSITMRIINLTIELLDDLLHFIMK